MKITLGIKAMSYVVSMSNCPKATEGQCGIMYRAY